MGWIRVKDKLPDIEEWEPGSVSGRSDAVLVYCADFENDTAVAIHQFDVAVLFKGGDGDLTTLRWDCMYFEPTHWQPIVPPEVV